MTKAEKHAQFVADIEGIRTQRLIAAYAERSMGVLRRFTEVVARRAVEANTTGKPFVARNLLREGMLT